LQSAESQQRIVYFDLDVKIWAKNPPSVAAARPPTCPCCGQAGAPAGAPIGVVGHGLRERTVLGPWAAGGVPEEVTFHARRYRCIRCEAVLSVVPRGVLRGMVYGALAIALALALWLAEPSWRVRERVSPRRGDDSEREHGWRAVSRWARDATRLWPWVRLGTRQGRQRVEQIVQQLAARSAQQRGALATLACDGALRS
jgi:hypothetical protein